MLDTANLARDRALIVLARHPRAGQVKTRLASSIGDTAAADLYRAFLIDIRRRLGPSRPWTLRWAFAPADSPFVAEIAGGCPAFPQCDGDLGERMAGAIARAIGEGCRRVVLIGSDIPHVAPERIGEAFDALDEGIRLVLGPAEDGGYYLVGACEVVPAVFDGISWGGPRVLAQTLCAAERAGISPRLLAPAYDVDCAADLERLRRDVTTGAVADLSATREVLERLARVGYT